MDYPPFQLHELDLLHAEGECLVVNKPGGILTQAPPGIESMESRVRRFLRQRDQVPVSQTVYVGMPHRLDRPASGLLLFGTSRKTTRKLAQQFERRTIRKTYWALVEGTPPEGHWEDWMRKVPDQPHSEIVSSGESGAQQAILDARVLANDQRWSLLEIQLQTGRTHQIRLQTSYRGCPILGDQQYGSQNPFGPQSQDQRKRWIALHARWLDFWHPQRHQPVSVTAPVPAWWRQAAADWDWERLEKLIPGNDEIPADE